MIVINDTGFLMSYVVLINVILDFSSNNIVFLLINLLLKWQLIFSCFESNISVWLLLFLIKGQMVIKLLSTACVLKPNSCGLGFKSQMFISLLSDFPDLLCTMPTVANRFCIQIFRAYYRWWLEHAWQVWILLINNITVMSRTGL